MSEVYVELLDDEIVRIFRSYDDAVHSEAWDEERVVQCELSEAVTAIRLTVCESANGECQDCGEYVGWAGHMHEVKTRGQGGEISTENSIWLCADCHLNHEHGDRKTSFGDARSI